MSIPINKYESTFHTETGYTDRRKTLYTQTGTNLQELKGTSATQYSVKKCFTTSIMYRISSGAAFIPGHCDAQFGLYGLLGTTDPRYTPTNNRAYANFVENSTNSQSQVGTAIAEWRQSVDMVTSATLSLADMVRRFKRGRPAKLAKKVRLNPSTGKVRILDTPRRVAESASNAWLQWWFGVSPVIGDVVTSYEQLSEPVPSGENYEGTSRCLIDRTSGTVQKSTNTGLYKVATGARVSLTNPNLYLANQLGLVNPASVAFEIIPFSFLADWAFDVSSFISSFTDFVGCSVSMPYTSKVNKGFVSSVYPSLFRGTWVAHQSGMTRVTTLIRPRPNYQVQANLGMSLTRAASATALLIQALR